MKEGMTKLEKEYLKLYDKVHTIYNTDAEDLRRLEELRLQIVAKRKHYVKREAKRTCQV